MTITNSELIEKCALAARNAFATNHDPSREWPDVVFAVLAVLAEPGNVTDEMFDAFDAAPLYSEYSIRTGPHFAVKVAIAAAMGSILK